MSETPQTLIAGRYRLMRLVGEGGMGRVWHAHDETLHREVAVKELVTPSGLTERQRRDLRERVMREARAIARLDHPNVVRVFDVFHAHGEPWIVMEYVPSRPLHEVLETRGPMSPERVARIGLEVLAALRAAHEAGLLHRDVKPANVLLSRDGRVVLTDFGLATALDNPSMTQTGVVLGSPAYLAPERATGSYTGPEGDVWSLGATLYDAVEGRGPYDRETTVATLTAIATEQPDPPRQAGVLTPALEGMLRRDRSERIGLDEAERLLRLAAEGKWAKLPSTPRRSRPPRRRHAYRSRRIVTAAAMLAVLMAAASIAVWRLPKSGADPTTSTVGVEAGWHEYRGAGYLIRVPDGWPVGRDAGRVEFRETSGSRLLTVEDIGAIRGGIAGFAEQRLRTDRVNGPYVDYKAVSSTASDKKADLEFTYAMVGGVRWHARVRFLAPDNGSGYVISWHTREDVWAASQQELAKVADSFRVQPRTAPKRSPTAAPTRSDVPTDQIPSATLGASGQPAGQLLVNAVSGRCLDVPGEPDSTGSMHVWTCINVPGEKYAFSERTVRVVNRCLQANGATVGATLRVAQCTGASNQRFIYQEEHIVSLQDAVKVKLCVDLTTAATVNNGDVVTLAECSDSRTQLWRQSD